MKQIHEVLRVGFEPATHGLEVQHPNHSATLPSVAFHWQAGRSSTLLSLPIGACRLELQAVPCSCFLGEAEMTSYQEEHAPKFITGASLNIIMGSTPCTAAI